MKKVKSPCDYCKACKNEDSAYATCTRWRLWFSRNWNYIRKQAEMERRRLDERTNLDGDREHHEPIP